MSADGGPITLPLSGKIIRAADLFCGAGGTSTGARRAITQLGGTLKLVAVNHWQTAIDTHTRMHPEAQHLCADLESVRPLHAVPGGVLDLLMASPTCTFYSRARGGKPVNDQQRMDPWHVVRWCTELRVKRLLVENVPEMMDWGPCSVQTGRPIPSRKGEYFRAWIAALEAIGFRVDHRVLCCADYGDPTTRERFFLIGRSDRKPLRWPEPTHARAGATDLLGTRAKWRGAVEIIDWSRSGKSIFSRKKPLKPNTIRRILAGAIRYFWPQPYIDALQALLDGREPVLEFKATDVLAAPLSMVMAVGSGGAAREIDQPVPTITAGGNGASPHILVPLVLGTGNGTAARGVEQPMPTITTGGAGTVRRRGNARPALLAPYYGSGSGLTSQPVTEPVPAVTTKARFGVADPVLLPVTHRGGENRVQGLDEPMPTVTGANRGEYGVADPVITRTSYSDPKPHSVDEPLQTITTARGGDFGLSAPFLVPNFGERQGQEPRTHAVDDPVPTITAQGHIQLAQPAADGYRIDILYRMLHWRELAGAMSFDDEGEVYDFAGTGTDITKQIGNAVPGRTAKALVRALVETP